MINNSENFFAWRRNIRDNLEEDFLFIYFHVIGNRIKVHKKHDTVFVLEDFLNDKIESK